MTRSDRPTPFRRLGAVLLGVIALGGCGGGDGADDPDRPRASALITEASRATLEKGSARQRFDFHTEPARKLAFTMDGVVDMDADDNEATIRYESFEGVEPGTEIEWIGFDDVDYFRESGQETWLKTETTEEDALANANDVPSGLRNLGGVANDAKAEGRETVAGAAATRYSATIDLERVPETLPPEHRDKARALLARFRKPEMPVKVWIGDDGVIRKLRYDMPFANLKVPGNGEEKMVVSVELSDFGTPADIEPPPPEQTIDE